MGQQKKERRVILGRLAQLVQSVCLTSRMSAVQIRYRPLKHLWGGSSIWLEHRPVTSEVASSSLVHPALQRMSELLLMS